MNDNVQVSITATDEGASSVISSFEQRLVALETAYKKSAGAADITSAAVKGSGDAASVATGKWEGLGAALEQMSGHARTVGIALNAAGMETGAAVAKIDGLAAAFKGLQAATGPLLVALLGLEALTKVFEFFKDGAAEAAQMQANMNSLAASVESQGKQWESLRDGVEQWLDTESIATGFLQSELLPALNQLVSDGRDVHDAEIMASVGAEIARDKHISLEEAVNAVAGAFVGLNRGVLIHDEGLRKLIKSGADEQQILDYLHDKYKRAINDHNDAKVAADRQHAAYAAMAEQIGKSMLPAMQYLSEAFIGGMGAAKDFVEMIGSGIKGAVMIVVDGANAMIHALGAVEDLLHGDRGAAAKDFGQAVSLAGKAAGDGFAWIPAAVRGMNDLFHMHANGHAVINNAIYAAENRSTTLDDNGPVRPHKDHGGSGHHGGAGHHGSGRGHSEGADFNFKALEDQLKPAKKSVDEFQLALDKLPKTVDGYKTAIAQLTDVIAKETVEHNALVKQQKDAHDMYEALLKVYNEFGASLGKHPTKAEKQELSDLAAQVRGAKADYDHLTTAVDNNTTALQKHQQQLIHDSAEEQRLIEEVAKKHEEAYQKMENEAKKYADEVIKFFEKMGKSGKSVFQDLEDAFKTMIENMIKKWVESKLSSIFMQFLGAGGASAAASSFPVAGIGMLLPGMTGGAAPAMVSTSAGQALAVHVAGVDSSLMGATAPGGALVSAGGGATLLGGLAGIGGGAMLGGIGASLTHGNQGNGMIGGALGVAGLALVQGGLVGGGMMGGLGSLLAAGPAGWAILAGAGLLGGLAGGMFGGPKMNPTNNPDQFQGGFAQTVANIQGQAYSQAEGWKSASGPTQLSIIDAWVKAHPGGQGLTGQDLANWQQANQLTAGGTAVGMHGLNNGNMGLSTSMDNNAPLIASTNMNWQDLANKLGNLTNAIQSNTTAQQAAVFTITRSYPDFNASSIAGATGTPGTGTGTGTGGGIPGVPGGHIVPPRMRGHGDTSDSPVINVTIQGSVVGPGGISDVAQAISKELAKINRGQAFGAYVALRNFGS